MDFNNKKLLYIIAAIGIVLVGIVVFSVVRMAMLSSEVEEAKLQNEQLELTNQELSLSNEYAAIDSEFKQYENQATAIANDTILAKYTAAKDKIEQLMAELKSEKTKSQAQIKKLQEEIATLRGILKHYVAQIDSLSKENSVLRDQNQNLTKANDDLNSKITNVTNENKDLNQRITLAEKLNVTALSLTPLKGNGKEEKKVTKAKQLRVTFTITQNNSTPVGEKTIYLRLISPEGSLLGNAGTFSFEDGSVPYTAKKIIDYAGDEIPGIKIYWDVNTALSPGEYTVELFADNYRLASRRFILNK